ncbi:MAG: nucleoside-diphosphate kinase [Peptococcaceae bacterium]|nr:nucleoside-diphosphate kinase [Peptococcaceae bacterium]
MEKTFAMIKPDAVQRGLVGEIIRRYEQKGLRIAGMKVMMVTEELAMKHYAEHVNKPFFPGLKDYITSGPVVALVLEGKNAVAEVRKINGSTNPLDAACGTIRGDFAQEVGRNVVHGSDSVESAANEISIYFTPEEVLDFDFLPNKWLYE